MSDRNNFTIKQWTHVDRKHKSAGLDELHVWFKVFLVALEAVTVLTNILCAILKIRYSPKCHKQSKVYFINLAFSNILRGSFSIYIMTCFSGSIEPSETHVTKLYYYLIILDYFDHLPFIALFTMLLDVAYYCKYSLDYNARMTKTKLYGCQAAGWIYVAFIISIGYGERIIACYYILTIQQVGSPHDTSSISTSSAPFEIWLLCTRMISS